LRSRGLSPPVGDYTRPREGSRMAEMLTQVDLTAILEL